MHHSTTYQAASSFVSSSKKCLLICLISVLFSGCGAEQESLHEHDHENPPHWPTSMQNAAELIQTRLNRLTSTSSLSNDETIATRDELLDLVEWSPEIAADTDLTEEQWIPIYSASEAIRGRIRSSTDISSELSTELEKLMQLLTEAHGFLPPEQDEG